MKNYFKMSDFNISGQPIPEDVADKLLFFHIIPMNAVREEFGMPIWPSMKSGYRPYSWEKLQGREGNSQHVFRAKGAVDWTCNDFQQHKAKLLGSIVKLTDYTRICDYNTFFHCDYAGIDRWYYEDTPQGWKRLWEIQEQ